ncbi:MAG: hypothetical protein A2Z97_08115 [Bdellovibrionales bacterium GWB1_52_6]|nr:MAG: hypothetical protein A2Z97_08115 [Bdellovibrionales bacterium GWB1_52_6]
MQKSSTAELRQKWALTGINSGEIFGGLSAALVALPSAIAFGLVVYAPLGGAISAEGALAGILGTIALGLVAPVLGGAPRLITAPCAPAAAVLGALVAELIRSGGANLAMQDIPILLTWVALISGALQFLYGYFKGGRLIKYIPYPVVAGYLSGVGVLIILGQFPKLLGLPKQLGLGTGLFTPAAWSLPAIGVGIVAMLFMIVAPRIVRSIPAPIVALAGGALAYYLFSIGHPELATLEHNPLVIGPITGTIAANTELSGPNWMTLLLNRFSAFASVFTRFEWDQLKLVLYAGLTLSVLLSIDTLKTCVVLDALTRSRHNSNRELIGQGLGNLTSALAGGMPGAGTMGATLVNMSSGGKGRASGVFSGIFSLLAFLLLGSLVAWVPVSALAGILLVVGFRMIDRNSVRLLGNRSTVFDFVVVAAVVATAITFNLIAAAGVGLGLAILLFLRDQIRGNVVRRKTFGNQYFSKKRRLPSEIAILEKNGGQTAIFELQGSLFFGTTDQLFSELEPYLAHCKHLILDMKRVQSVDFTAAHMLEQIEAQLGEHEGTLIFSNLPTLLPSGKDLQQYFDQVGLVTPSRNIKVFDNLDVAVEWAEEKLLIGELPVDEERPLELSEIDFLRSLPAAAHQALRACANERELKKGELVFSAGDRGDEIFLIRKGTVRIVLPLKGRRRHHLATFGRGDFFGDMAFLDKGFRSADAEAGSDTELFCISREKFDGLSSTHAELSGQVFSHLARTLALRLRQADLELRAQEES